VAPPPEFGTRIRADLLKGLGKVGARFVLILDIDRVLSAPAGV
jgi:purine-binding chemotaxis protein CheW